MSLGEIYTRIALLSPRVEVLLRKLYWYNVKWLKRFNPFTHNGIVETQAKTCEFDEVLDCIRKMGVGEGALLVVHSSYDALASTGLSPKEIVEKLIELVGETGTLAMPVIRHYKDEPEPTEMLHADLKSIVCRYDVKRTVVSSGLLPTFLKKRSDAVISHHPLNPLCAVGPLAKEMMAHNLDGESPAPHGPNSSWKFCYDHDAIVLWLGVDSEHYNTMIHVSDEAMGNWPWSDEEWYDKRRFILVDEEKNEREITVKERKQKWGLLHLAEKNLNRDLVKNTIVRKEIVGGQIMVCMEKAKDFVDFLQNHPHKGYPYY